MEKIAKLAYMRIEAADALQVSLPTLDAWIRRAENPLPSIRAGKKILIPVEGLSVWVREEAARCSGKQIEG